MFSRYVSAHRPVLFTPVYRLGSSVGQRFSFPLRQERRDTLLPPHILSNQMTHWVQPSCTALCIQAIHCNMPSQGGIYCALESGRDRQQEGNV
jgi:hypothetical protein